MYVNCQAIEQNIIQLGEQIANRQQMHMGGLEPETSQETKL